MNSNLVFLIIFIIFTTSVPAAYGAPLGCYEETKRSRKLDFVPPHVDKDEIAKDVSVCSRQCGIGNKAYAGIWNGEICLCGDSITEMTKLSSIACTGEQNQGLTVYNSALNVEIPDLDMGFQPASPDYFFTYTARQVSATGSNSRPSAVIFRMNFGEIFYVWEPFESPVNATSVTYIAPGVKDIKLQAISAVTKEEYNKIYEYERTAREVRITERLNLTAMNFTCPPNGATLAKFFCHLEIGSGSNMNATINWDGTSEEIYVPDLPWERAGSSVAHSSYDLVPWTSKNLVLVNAVFQWKGRLDALELYARYAGQITVLLLRPVCASGQSFCFMKDACDADTLCSSKATCASPLSYCPYIQNCYSTCSTWAVTKKKNGTGTAPSMSLKVAQSLDLTISSAGYMSHQVAAQWQVLPGDRLAFFATNTSIVGVRNISEGENSDFVHNTQTGKPADAATVTAAWTEVKVQHQISAVSRPYSLLWLGREWKVVGNKSIGVTLENTIIGASSRLSFSGYSDIEPGINVTEFDFPGTALTNENTSIPLVPHSGRRLKYYYDFGDGQTNNFTTIPAFHTYTKIGTFNISVNVWNEFDNGKNMTEVRVYDRVNITNFTVPLGTTGIPVTLFIVLASGSNYTCQWSMPPLISMTTQEGNLSYTLTPTRPETYEAKVNCSNEASWDSKTMVFKVYEKIIGLTFSGKDILAKENTKLSWTYKNGTNITFELAFANKTLTFTTNEAAKSGESQSFLHNDVGIFQATLRATNPISEVVAVCNVSVHSKITDAVVKYQTYTALNTDSKININASQGSSVRFTIQWGDGATNETANPLNVEWPGVKTVTRRYASAGIYNFQIFLNNTASTANLTGQFIVLNPLGTYTFKPKTPVYDVDAFAEFDFTRTTGEIAVAANVTFDWDDGTPEEMLIFNVSKVYKHKYTRRGDFQVKAIIKNPVNNTVNVQVLTAVVHTVENVTCKYTPMHLAVGKSMMITMKMDEGDNVNVTVTTTDSAAPQVQRIYNASSTASITRTFSTPGTFDLFVTSCNRLGCKNCTHKVHVDKPIDSTKVKITFSDYAYLPTASGPANVTLEWTGASGDFPTNVNYTIFCADGDSNVTGQWTTNPTQLIKRPFTKTGKYDCTIILENYASEMNKTANIPVYEPLGNVTLLIQYRQAATAPLMNGFGEDKNRYPANVEVHMTVNITKGWVDHYILSEQFLEGNASINTCTLNSTNATKVKSFSKIGDYRILVVGSTPIETKTLARNISIGGSIKNPKFYSDSPKWKRNQNGILVLAWEILSTDSCVCVDFGHDNAGFIYAATKSVNCSKCPSFPYNGVIPPVSPLRINHYFPKNSDYNVTVFAYNDMANVTLRVVIPVSDLDCAIPKVGMKNGHYTYSTAQEGIRSEIIQIMAEIVALPCKATPYNDKDWMLEVLDPKSRAFLRYVNLTKVVTTDTVLRLPETFLEIGVYRATFIVTMDKNITKTTFMNKTRSYLIVKPSPIVVAFTKGGMSSITKGVEETICLDVGKHSRDPDVANASNPQGLGNWTWYCHREGETPANDSSPSMLPKPANFAHGPTRTGCFGTGPARINNVGNSTLCFAASNMEVNKTYVMRVRATKGDRSSDSTLEIRIVEGVPPKIDVKCRREIMCRRITKGKFRNLENSVNPSETVQLSGSCEGKHCSENHFRWEMQYYSATEEWHSLEGSYGKFFGDLKNKDLSIGPGLFDHIPGRIRFKGCFFAGGGINEGSSCLQFVANKLPIAGFCNITPPANVTVSTKVCIQCFNFTDSDGIETYTFFTQKPSQKERSSLGFNSTGHYCTKLPFSEETINISVTVEDKLGGQTTAIVGLIKMEKTNLNSLNNVLTNMLTAKSQREIETIFAKGDITAIGSKIIETSAVIEAMSRWSRDRDSNKDTQVSKKQRQNEERDRSSLLAKVSENLKYMQPQDKNALKIASSAIKTFSKNKEDVPSTSQTQVMDKIAENSKMLEKLSGSMSKEDVISVAGPMMESVISMVEMTTYQIANPVILDYDKAVEDRVYETDLESESLSLLNSADPLEALTLETSSNSQKKTASGVASSGILDVMSSVSKTMLKVMVPGDKPVEYETPAGKMQFQKPKSPMDLTNQKLEARGASVKLPNICGSIERSGRKCNESGPGVSVFSAEFNYLAATPMEVKGGIQLSYKNPVIGLSIISDNGGSLPVDTSADGDGEAFDLDIPMPKGSELKFEPANKNGKPFLATPMIQPGTGGALEDPIYIYQKVFMHSLKVDGTEQSIHFQMKFDNYTQFLVVARLADPTDLDKDDGYTFWGMIPNDVKYSKKGATIPSDIPDPFTFFIGNTVFKEKKEEVFKRVPDWQKKRRNLVNFGVRELLPSEYNKYTEKVKPKVPYPYVGNISTNYDVRIFSKSCLAAADKPNARWSTGGCNVSPFTTADKTKCLCTHLTSFTGGFVVAPNSIDFNYVFANFDFSKNATLFATEIAIFTIYLAAMIWAHFMDKKDIEKLGVTPLPDNDPNDQYLYEITVETGRRPKAGTDSKVCFVLSGEHDESDIRMLEDPKRKILVRGETNRFLMAVPRPLGNLQYVRLWHDSSGKGSNCGWYCAYFGVMDLQTRQRSHFLVNHWFAVEEEDGMVDRLIPVSGPDEMTQFSEMFNRKAQRDFTDGHLWLSVLMRPPESRFTRSGRISVCLLLLFLTMLATCMFYKKPGGQKSAASAGLSLGPFKVTPEELWVGFVTNLITFAPILLAIQLFNRTRLYNSHTARLLTAVMTHFKASDDASAHLPARAVNYQASSPRPDYEMGDQLIVNEAPPPYSSHDRLRLQTPRGLDQVNVDVSAAPNGGQDGEEEPPPFEKKKLFPWWVRIFTWIYMFIAIFLSSFFTTLYGIQFGDAACKQWLSAMFISFFSSIMLTQPIKVIFMALILSLICKSNNALEEEQFEGDEDIVFNEVGKRNGLKFGEEYLHSETLSGPMRPRRAPIQPPNEEDLERMRAYRLKELKMYDILREILFYLLFFLLLLLVTYSFRDPNSFHLKTQMANVYTNPGHSDLDFMKIRSEDDFWNFTEKSMLPALRATKWYNGDPPLFQRGFTGDRVGRLMGYAVIRQIRVRDESCVVHGMFKNISKDCVGAYSMSTEDKGYYLPKWEKPPLNMTRDMALKIFEAFVYKDADTLDGYPYIGQISSYLGGGFVHELRGGLSTLQKEMKLLRSLHWIDKQTRAIFIEFTVYVPNANLFGVATMLLEAPGTSGFWPSFRFEPANLLSFMSSGAKAFEIACQALWICMLIFYLVKEARKMYKEKKGYFIQFWNWIEMFIIGGSFGSIAAYAFMIIATKKLVAEFAKYNGNRYLKFQFVAYWHENLSYATSFIVFAATIKFIRLLRFNRRMGMLGAVLSYSSKDMRQFFIIFFLVFFAFVQTFYLLFMGSLYRYHSFLHSMEASMQIALGKFEFLELYQAEPIIGPIVFVAFVLFIIFVMLNMFLAILNEAFAEVRSDMELQSNDFEMVDFVMRRFMLWTGIHHTQIGRKVFKEEMAEQEYKETDPREAAMAIADFPQKVDQLANYITAIYTREAADESGGQDILKIVRGTSGFGPGMKMRPGSSAESSKSFLRPDNRGPSPPSEGRVRVQMNSRPSSAASHRSLAPVDDDVLRDDNTTTL